MTTNDRITDDEQYAAACRYQNGFLGRVDPITAFMAGSEWARGYLAEQERDHWKREADGANADLADLRAAKSRPLTPDAITDEMVKRAAHCLAKQRVPLTYSIEPDKAVDKFYDDAREVLYAALTEPPARPEGAEEIEAIIADQTGGDVSPAAIRDLANRLAERGVRVISEEDPSGPLRPLTTDQRSYRYAQDLGYELPEDPR